MKLRELLLFDNVVIQCHDNPDADAISSAFGVYCYLKQHGKKAEIIYGGPNVIRKSNLLLMINELHIPVKHRERLEPPDLLVTVDCQYGEGNVTHFDAKEVAVLDHHRVSGALPERNEVRSTLGACATLIWQMLKDEGIDVNTNQDLATALYYGLYTDTNSFTELSHPLDRDFRDAARYDKSYITKFSNSNLSIEELEVAGASLLRSDYVEGYRFAIVKAGQCDTNILGIISDLVLSVDSVDTCLVFNVQPNGIKMSVRSCAKEVRASDLAAEICRGIGTGGGHAFKAGGSIKMELMVPAYLEYCKENGLTPRMELTSDGKKKRPTLSALKAFFQKRAIDYFENTEIIYADNHSIDTTEMDTYRKKPIPLGYILPRELFAEGTAIIIRTIDGDLELTVQHDTVIMLGIKGEVYINNEERFLQSYRVYDWKFHLDDVEYTPVIKDIRGEQILSPLDYTRVCIPNGESAILAKCLDHRVKVFTVWDTSMYKMGEVGDYLAIRDDDHNDIYTIRKDIFEKCYEPVKMQEKSQPKAAVFELEDTLICMSKEKNKNCQLPNDVLERNIAYLLQELKNRNIRIAVISRMSVDETTGICSKLFPELVDYVGSLSDDKDNDRDIINQILAELDASRDGAVCIGNTKSFKEVSKREKIRFIYSTWWKNNKKSKSRKGNKEEILRPVDLLYRI